MSTTRNKKSKSKVAAPQETNESLRWYEILAHVAGPALIIAAGVAMLCRTWGTWPDVIIDFGRELYVPWRLSEGEVLYRDLAYFNGPLSPYVNSLWFRLFGTGLHTLVLANLVILAALLSLLYALLVRIGSRTSATLACLVMVCAFAFSRYTIAGNYNYLCPYSHEATHGVTLAVAAFYFLARFIRSARLSDVALCGFCVGLVALTKPEILIATFPATAIGVALAVLSIGPERRQIGRTAAAFIGPMVVPAVVATALLSLAISPIDAAAGTLGGWKWMFATDITSLPYYRHSMGSHEALKHLGAMLSIVFWYAFVLGLPGGVGVLVWRSRASELAAAAVCGVVVLLLLVWNLDSVPTSDTLRPLPLVMLTILAAGVVMWKRQPDAVERGRLSLLIALACFALLMMAKIILHVRLIHYGFYLSMPATLLLVVALWDWAPRGLVYCGGSGWMLRGAFLAALSIVLLRCIDAASKKLAVMTVPVGSGADAFYADSRGREVNRLLAELDSMATEDATLAVVPEGIMLNYLSRRRDSTRYISLMPVEVLMFGETAMLAAFREHPPDFLILTDEDMNDYGFQDFRITNDGYADLLGTWFSDNYQLVGKAPNVDGALLHGVLLQYIRPDEPTPQPAKADTAPAERE